MKYTLAALTRRAAARLLAAPPKRPGQLGVEHLERRDTPAGTYTGVVFQDFNGNGVRDVNPTATNTGGATYGTTALANDRGLGGVVVTAYAGTVGAADGQVAQTTTAANGTYTLTVPAPALPGPYRVEFTTLPAGFTEGPTGTNSKTSVQFVQPNAGGAATEANVSLGITRFADYAQDLPLLATTVYNYGAPDGNDPSTAANPRSPEGGNANAPAIVAFASNVGIANGSPAGGTGDNYQNSTVRNVAIPFNRVGATYGMAYDPYARNLYASAYFKRHTGLLGAGNTGTGAIYRATLPTDIATQTNFQPAGTGSLEWANLNTIFGANTAGVNAHNTADYFSDNGNTAWAAVGTTGLGGLDVSDDGRFVFVMNLADRQLYRLPTSGPLNTTTVQRVSIPLTNPDTSVITAGRFRSADLRPFAVQYYRGEVYVGVVYSAQTLSTGPNDAAARAEMLAAVYKVNPNTMTFTSAAPVFSTKLDYPRAQSSTLFAGANATVSPWRPWSATYFSTATSGQFGVAPQAMLSDIAFDADGNMTLGLRDRGADQIGNFTYSNPGAPTTEIEAFTTGDMLRATVNTNGTSWTLESNARDANGNGTGTQGTNFGPGGGEFYHDEFLPNSHGETTIGGMLQLPGRPDVISAQMDPGTNTRSAGLSWMNNTSGSEVKAFELYHTPDPNETNFSKANGVGGLAAILDVAPIEVGNRVWVDSDRDGVQDATEAVLPNVTVQLLNSVGAVIATAVTALDGSYYFTSAPGTATASRRTGVPFTPGAAYTVRVPNAAGAGRQTALTNYLPTVADNAGASAGSDLRDSDGAVVGTSSEFSFVAGQANENTHAVDFGFRPVSTVAGVVYYDQNNDGSNAGDPTLTGAAQQVQVRLTGVTADGVAVTLTTTTVNGAYSFRDLDPSNAAGYTITQLAQPTGYLDGKDTRGTPYGTPGVVTPESESIPAVVIPDNGVPNAGTGYNFGELLPASLGNFVWLDANANGQQDAGEPGVDGVTVTLTGTNDLGTITPISVTTGDDPLTAGVQAGFYAFRDLRPGTYTVTFGNVATVGGVSTTYTRTFQLVGATATDSNADRTTGAAPAVTLAAGQDDPTIDAGLYLPVSLGDTVYYDTDGNGAQGAGEPGIVGATVTLTYAGPDGLFNGVGDTTTTTTTGANGFYQFTGLAPGNYRVTVSTAGATVNGNVIGSATNTDDPDAGAPDGTALVTLTSGVNNQAQDFGYRAAATQGLGNFVWLDTNGNGRQDAGEAGIDGITVELLDGAGNVVRTTTTGDDPNTAGVQTGYYEFRNLPTGTYSVRFGNTAGGTTYTRTRQDSPVATDATDSDASTVAVGPVLAGTTANVAIGVNEFDPTIDAGLYLPVSLGDTVYFDADGNGAQNNGEPGIVGATVTLVYAGPDGDFATTGDNVTTTTVTGAAGNYQFAGLAPGNYRVSIDTTGSTVNGVAFSAPPTPSDDPDAGAPNGTADVTLASGATNQAQDFGFTRLPGSLGDLVWLDLNKNGVFEAANGEKGLAGYTVTAVWAGVDNDLATTADNKTYTTVTGANGDYLFTGLPAGTYQVTIAAPAGSNLVNTYDLDSGTTSPDGKAVVTLVDTPAGKSNLNVDFGLAGTAKVGDLVWFDVNGDGVRGANEPGIPGATVVLRGAGSDNVLGNADDFFVTVVTDSAGFYRFDNLPTLAGGTQYSVTVTPPAGYPTQTYDKDGTGTANTSTTTLTGTQFDNAQDFGYRGPLGQGLGDFVWLDANGNGRQDTGEAGINGVTVELLDANGVVLATTTTVNNPVGGAPGYYEFRGLPTGTYSVRFGNTAGGVTYTRTRQDSPVATDATDSDASTATGQTTPTTIDPSEFDPTIDAGLYLPVSLGDRVWFDTNGNGAQDAGEPGIVGATVTVTYAGPDGAFGGADDVLVTVTATGADGVYVLSGLTPGNYRVSVDPSTGTVNGNPVGTVSATFDLDSGTANPDGTSTQVILSNENPRNVDFGYANFPGSLGDRVWLDRNSNGVQDPGEPGLVGISVTAVWAGPDGDFATAGDNKTYTTVTGADGAYGFPALPLGSFRVTANTAGTNLANTYDLDGGLDNTALVTLTFAAPARPDVDFGVVGAASVGDLVWFDADNNGSKNNAEPGIAGATVTLRGAGADGVPGNADDLVLTTVTDANGNYLFTGLPTFPGGTRYEVTVTPTAQYPTPSSDADGVGTPNVSVVVLTGSQSNVLQDFGYRGPLGQGLGNFVWLDANGNGRQDAGEAGVNGVLVELLDAAGNLLAATTTGDDPNTAGVQTGYYEFKGLPAAGYFVRFGDAAAGVTYTRTRQDSPVADGTSDSNASAVDGKTALITLPAGTFDPTIDAGLYSLVSFGNRVWFDTNGSGTQDAGEPGINGATVTAVLTNPDGSTTTLTTVTAGDGEYQFTGLTPGTYRVTVTVPGTATANGSPVGTVSATYDLSGPADGDAQRVVDSGTSPQDVDFGFANFPGALGNRVWLDRNADGVQATDGTEPGIAGLSVDLVWAGPNGLFGDADDRLFAPVVTGADGVYNFTGLPVGKYRVTVNTAGTNLANTSDFGTGTVGPDGVAEYELTLANPVTDLVDFGVVGNASVGDLVWYDADGNGVRGPNEPGIGGATVTLTGAGANGVLGDGDDLTLTTITDALGGYSFPGLPVFGAGTPYRVTVTSTAQYPAPTFDADGAAGTPNTSTLTLAPNTADTLQDFGYRGPLTQGLGNFVWLDANGNGRQDAGEAGVNGVTVELLDAAGNVLNATTTANDPNTGAPGYYEFRGLATGTYAVRFGNAANGVTYTRTQQSSPAADAANDSDATTLDGRTPDTVITSGEFDPTVDAGLYLPVSLGDTVWFDANRNGAKEANEPGLAGVTVSLDYAGPDGVFGTADDVLNAAPAAVTDANGQYSFTNLRPGTYRATVNTATLPNGITSQTFDRDGLATAHSDTAVVSSPLAPAAGLTDPAFDFGYAGSASLGDTVWYDLNRDGVQNNGEPGIANVTVTLTWAGPNGLFGDADDFVYPAQTTDAQGRYLFAGLPAGAFRATVTTATLPAGTRVNTFDLDGGTATPNSAANTTLATGQARRDVDFGYAGTGVIGDSVYADINGNGSRQPNEPGITGVTVILTWTGPDGVPGTADDAVLTTTTGPGGTYSFTGLPEGTYTVSVVPPSGGAQSADPNGPFDNAGTAVLTPGGTDLTQDFGYQGVASVAGTVFVDSNRNGVRDPGEPTVPGVTVALTGTDTSGNTVTRTATTDGQGRYVFPNLQPGVYSVTETQPTQYADGADTAGTVNGTRTGTAGNDVVSGIVLGPLDTSINNDFGELGGTIDGTVFDDRNDNGVQDAGDEGLPGVLVICRLLPNGPEFTATTDADGNYRFEDLPGGTYTVTEIQPTGLGDSPAGPAAPNTRTVPLTPGGTAGDQDFGDTFGELSGTVFVDANNDGVRQAGEPTIPGVTLVLLDATGRTVGTTTTDANGFYQFTGLVAGTYAVVEFQPAGYQDGADTPGPNGGVRSGADGIAGIPVAPGGSAPGNDFGEVVVPAAASGSVSGTVFADRDRDGVQGPGEAGIPGVTVQLLDPNGNVVATTTTDANGNYRFDNVPAGTYVVREVQPTALGTTPNTGDNTRTVVVTQGSNTVAAAFPDTLGSLSGTVYRDTNQSGTRDANEAGIPGVTVTLFDGAGNPVASTTTDADGNYRFTGLPAGTYTVVEAQPGLPTSLTNGFYDGSDNPGNFGGTGPFKNGVSFTLPAGGDAVAYDFGELPPADPFGFVFVDINRDGVRGPTEPGIPGVVVTISGTAFAGTPFARPLTAADIPGGLTRVTDANGRWEFAPMPPGVYTVTEAQPAGYADGAEQVVDATGPNTVRVGNDSFSNLVLNPSAVRGPFNFGEWLVPATGPLFPIDFFPRTPTASTGRLDATKREFLGSSTGASAATGFTETAGTQSTAPAFSTSTQGPTYVAVAQDAGGGIVRVFDYQSGVERFRFRPFGDFTGGVQVATADVTGDGMPDIIATPGAGGGPIVRVFDGMTGREIANVMAFEESFRGGLQLAVGDTNGDGFADIVTAPDVGGGPIVRTFDGRTFNQTGNFFALDPTFRGGLRIAVGDLNADGKADLVVTAGVGGGPRVAGYDGSTLGLTEPTRLFGDYFAFAPELRSGFYVTAGDVDGDGFGDVVLGAGPGGGPRAATYSGRQLVTNNQARSISDLFLGDESSRAGVRVKAVDVDGDGRAEIVAVPGSGVRPVAVVVDPMTGATRDEFLAFPTDFLGGVTVG